MNLIELFQPSLRGRADKPAVRFDGTWLTFGRLDALSDAVATALRDRYGLRKGDRASMYLANCHELLIYYLACLKLGAIVVPLNLLYRDHELTALLGDAHPKVLLTDGERHKTLDPLRERFETLEHVFIASERTSGGGKGTGDAGDAGGSGGVIAFSDLMRDDASGPVSVKDVRGDDPALMLYTSGTTGQSKGALLTHHNLASNIVSLLHCWGWTERDRFVLALPLFHAHGLCNGFHGAMASGCTTFLFERFRFGPVLEALSAEKCTLFFGVPTMYERLLAAVDGGARPPKHMRLFVSGSAPLSPDTFARFRKVFGHEILERYGMSETVMITSNLYAGPRGQGTVGKPLPGVQVRVWKEDGSVATSPGEVGEIQVRGPNVLREYWRQPEKTAESFRDGWFGTGDLGEWDEEGRLIICGRLKELIISGGFNIYPQELINCLCDHPGVSEAAVVGVPDKVRGEQVKAYVVRADPALMADEVTDHCRAHLASFKVPRSVVFLDTLPRNAMGKIRLQDLPDRDTL